jgi:hypothetical protein
MTTLDGTNLIGNTDAAEWTDTFLAIAEQQDWTIEDIDWGLMIGWFSNAIMAGYDEGRRELAREMLEFIDHRRKVG